MLLFIASTSKAYVACDTLAVCNEVGSEATLGPWQQAVLRFPCLLAAELMAGVPAGVLRIRGGWSVQDDDDPAPSSLVDEIEAELERQGAARQKSMSSGRDNVVRQLAGAGARAGNAGNKIPNSELRAGNPVERNSKAPARSRPQDADQRAERQTHVQGSQHPQPRAHPRERASGEKAGATKARSSATAAVKRGRPREKENFRSDLERRQTGSGKRGPRNVVVTAEAIRQARSVIRISRLILVY